MTHLRILRNLALLTILTVAAITVTPRPAAAGLCPSVACGPNVTRCMTCSHVCRACFDLDTQKRCLNCF